MVVIVVIVLTSYDVFNVSVCSSEDMWECKGIMDWNMEGKHQPWSELAYCFYDRASWIDYILITSLMHWLLFIH